MMEKWKGWRKIKYESGLCANFPFEIASIPGGEKLFSCIQCGTCSGMCPVSPYMDYTPRQIIGMIRAGFKSEVLSSFTIWLCASCYSCSVECPKDVKLTDIMYAAKRLAIRNKVHPKRFPPQVLASEFYKLVEKYGRNTESLLLVRLFLKTNPFQLFKQMFLGFRLLVNGRMSVRLETIKRKKELRSLLGVLEKEHMVKTWNELTTNQKVVVP